MKSENIIEKILNIRDDLTIRLMPSPSFLKEFTRVIKYQRNIPPVEEFLQLGNCFWYILPEGYTEGGPKVCMEAMAAGLPVITDNHSGMKDRIVEGTGWLCNNIDEYLEVIKNLTPNKLKEYGTNAREYAKINFDPMNWIYSILGEI